MPTWEPPTYSYTATTCHRHISSLTNQYPHSNALTLLDIKDHGDLQVICYAVLSCSVVSNSLRPHGL